METYEKIENAETKELKYEAHVTIIIEPTEHFTTKPEKSKMDKKSNKKCNGSIPTFFQLDLFLGSFQVR